MNYYRKLSDLIGNTPLVEIRTARPDWLLLGKLEWFNPGGSIKDRAALGLITAAERRGALRRGMTMIESSSGNTAIALSILAAERGYKFVAVVDTHAPAGKIARIKAVGGELYYCDTSSLPAGTHGVDLRRKLARQLCEGRDDFINLDQYDNVDNRDFYRDTLGVELWRDTAGRMDILLGGVGTGSSLCGTAAYLKTQDATIQAYGVEPQGSVNFGKPGGLYRLSGPGFPPTDALPKNLDQVLVDKDFQVSDRASYQTVRYFGRERGLFLGDCAGMVLYQAMCCIRQSPVSEQRRVMVALLTDNGNSYMGQVFNDAWLGSLEEAADPQVEEALYDFYGV